MKPQSIWLGIDLGTTNSTIARVEGTALRVFRNVKGNESTPSAVWLDPANIMSVGDTAYQRSVSDEKNVAIEFKRNMGSKDEFRFHRSGLTMLPEQLSAEVLKCLRTDAERDTGEVITRAIITVPAAFEGPSRTATFKAAQLAGFEEVEFVQEPVAAALAYSFDHPQRKEFWIVFDFGGGTFDCAVMELAEGAINVVSHGGDNRLGGKNIDWDIVEQVFLPKLLKQHGASATPNRQDDRWRGAIAKLKRAAEDAKKELSTSESAYIAVENIEPSDSRGGGYDFEHTLTRRELETIARPLISRAITICKEVIARGSLQPAHIAKILLVGGPTMMPMTREMLASKETGLGIPLEFSKNPLTVVAQGAAIFGAQKVISVAPGATQEGHFGISVTAVKVSPDPDVNVAFSITGLPADSSGFQGYTLEVTNTSSRIGWSSGKLPLPPEGRLMTTVLGEQDKDNTFEAHLYDSVGRKVDSQGGVFNITITGYAAEAPKLPHSIGLALADNTVEIFMPRDTSLEAKMQKTLRTSRHLKAGEVGDLINVVVIEGENPRADRNKRVGTLVIGAASLTQDIPFNAPVEISITVDRSGICKLVAYVPTVDEFFSEILKGESYTPDSTEIDKGVSSLEQRCKDLDEEASLLGCTAASSGIKAFRASAQMESLARLGKASATDKDAARQADSRLIDANIDLDRIDAELAWPRLVAETRKNVADNMADSDVTEEGKKKTQDLAALAERQITTRDNFGLEQTKKDIFQIWFDANRDRIAAHILIGWKSKEPEFTDPSQGRRFLSQAFDTIDIIDGGERYRIKDRERMHNLIGNVLRFCKNSSQTSGDNLSDLNRDH